MNKYDNNILDFRLGDFLIALSLLSRIPVNIDHHESGDRASKATWAYPLVGALIGAISASIANIAIFVGLPFSIGAILSLITMAALTGGMHEDGLSDSADGLWGGKDKGQILQIMKDSRIGSFGAIALVLIIVGRYASIKDLIQIESLFWPLIAAASISRVPMVAAMVFMQNARADGLSASVGKPSQISLIVAAVIGTITCLISAGILGLLVVLCACLGALPILYASYKKINGQTGDILGASQQTAELMALACLVGILIIP
jgi:adenosylcobinamide-GDP ribazoletransferase